MSTDSFFDFAQLDAQRSAGSDPLSQGALGVSSRPGSSAPCGLEAGPAWLPRVGFARSGAWCSIACNGNCAFFSEGVSSSSGGAATPGDDGIYVIKGVGEVRAGAVERGIVMPEVFVDEAQEVAMPP